MYTVLNFDVISLNSMCDNRLSLKPSSSLDFTIELEGTPTCAVVWVNFQVHGQFKVSDIVKIGNYASKLVFDTTV